MSKRAGSRMFLPLIPLTVGGLGEIFSPALFGYGFSVDGMIALQTLFIGLLLLGYHMALGKIPQSERGTQSPPAPTPRSSSTEAPGVRAEGFQARFRRDSIMHTLALVAIVLIPLVEMLWLAAESASYGLLSESPESTWGFTNTLLQNSSNLAGVFLVVVTTCLRIGTDDHDHTMVRVSFVLLILTALLWVFAQWSGYAIALEYLGYLEPLDYIHLARFSSGSLSTASGTGLLVGLSLYLLGPTVPGTIEPTQKPAQTPA